jgi:hypothetical protein
MVLIGCAVFSRGVRGWLCRFSKSACPFLAVVLVKIQITLFQQAFWSA